MMERDGRPDEDAPGQPDAGETPAEAPRQPEGPTWEAEPPGEAAEGPAQPEPAAEQPEAPGEEPGPAVQQPEPEQPEPVASSWTGPAPESPSETPPEDLPDYYSVLGVPPGSDRRTVAEAYDRLSRELQPDVDAPPTDPERMRRVDEAFDYLDNRVRRAEYDRARGVVPIRRPSLFRPSRQTLLASGLILGGIAAIAGAAVVLVLALVDDGGPGCSNGTGEVVTTENGVQYEDLVVCGGPSISAGDTLEVNYIATLEDGTEFANTYEDGQVLRFLYRQAAVINGWDEGIAGMTVGSKRRVKIPEDVYGADAVNPNIIPPGSTLVFEVTVEGRIAATGPVSSPTPPLPTQEPTTAPEAPPEVTGEQIATGSGLMYIDIEEGTGDAAADGDTVVVNYTGWLADGGTKFDSSLERTEPFSFTLGEGRVIAGWDEGILGMKVGGKRRLIVPPDLGYGAQGFPPTIPANATLIFDVELVDVR